MQELLVKTDSVESDLACLAVLHSLIMELVKSNYCWLVLVVLMSLGTEALPSTSSDLIARLMAAEDNNSDEVRLNEVSEATSFDDCEDVNLGEATSRGGSRSDEVECVEVQEEECGACHSIFLRECSIRMEYSFHPEKVEECVEYPAAASVATAAFDSSANYSACEQGYRRVCRTTYRTECGTQMQYRDMEEDHPVCGVQMTEDCSKRSATVAAAKAPCRKVPVMRCRIEKRTVRKGQPETACRRVPEEICRKEKCAAEAGAQSPRRKCFERVRMSRELVPREECGYREKRVCQQTTQSDCRIRKRQECTPRYFVSRRQCKRVHQQAAKATPVTVKAATQTFQRP